VDFIEQENQTTGKLSFFSDFLQALLVVRRGIKGSKGILGRTSNCGRNRGLANPWRTVENHGRQHIGINHATDNLSRTDQVFLTDYLINGFGPHTKGEIGWHRLPFSVFMV